MGKIEVVEQWSRLWAVHDSKYYCSLKSKVAENYVYSNFEYTNFFLHESSINEIYR